VKKFLVIGLGKSGRGAVELLLKRGDLPVAFDSRAREDMEDVAAWLEKIGVEAYFTEAPCLDAAYDGVVVSPGVSLELPVVEAARQLNLPVIGELELAYQEKPAAVQIVAVTGTNGKTTTATLLYELLRAAGYPAVLGGNIGVPLSSLADQLTEGYWVVEASSFQLESIAQFRPRGAAIINLTPDHLDRHHTLEAYRACKQRIFMNQAGEDFSILNADDPQLSGLQSGGRRYFFSLNHPLEQGVWLQDEQIVLNLGSGRETVCAVREVKLKGRHNLENILCAVALAYLLAVPVPVTAEVLRTFTGVRHRIEEVATLEGVLYVNDSKGTNPVSTVKALEAFSAPIVLIAGGYDKHGGFEDLAEVLCRKVTQLILLGATQEEIARTAIARGFPPTRIHRVASLEAAVLKARDLAVTGDVVLLSPACASWDMFKDYEERGDQFCAAVRRMTQEDQP
jgi:UDP-N-acetylmuramoylalanine--D-glutamate ligase